MTEKESDHVTDYTLADGLCGFITEVQSNLKLAVLPTIDLGSGLGGYSNHLTKRNIISVSIDGNPHLEKTSKCNYIIADLVKDRLEVSSPIVLCLEVLNHIPKSMTNAALLNLRRCATGYLVMTWATPAQGGLNQLNPLPKDIFIQNIRDLGYKFHENYTNLLSSSCGMPWLKETITVFESI